MPRRPQLHADEIHSAADQLAAEGKDVTALALLDALGGGSLTTIYKHLESWKKSQPPVEKAATGGEVPQTVMNALLSTWRVARVEAEQETAAIREKAAEEVKAAQKQFADALEAIAKLEKDSEADAKTIEELTDRVAELEAAMHKALSEAAASKTAADQLKTEVTRLEAVSKQDRKERDAAMKETAKLTGQLEAVTAQNAKLMETLKPKTRAKK